MRMGVERCPSSSRTTVWLLSVMLVGAVSGCGSQRGAEGGQATLPATPVAEPVATEEAVAEEPSAPSEPSEPSATIGNVRVRVVRFDTPDDWNVPTPSEALITAAVGPPPAAVPESSVTDLQDLAYEAFPVRDAVRDDIEERSGSFGPHPYDRCEWDQSCKAYVAVVEDPVDGRMLDLFDLGVSCGVTISDEVTPTVRVETVSDGNPMFFIAWNLIIDPGEPCVCRNGARSGELMVVNALGRLVIRETLAYSTYECWHEPIYEISFRDVDGDGTDELVGEGGWTSAGADDDSYSEESYDEYASYEYEATATSEEDEEDEEDEDYDEGDEEAEYTREPWFVHRFDGPVASQPVPLANPRCAPPPAATGAATQRPPRRPRERRPTRAQARRSLHLNLNACDDGHVYSCFSAAKALRALRRPEWAEVVERSAVSATLESCFDKVECVLSQLSPDEFDAAAHPIVRDDLARWCLTGAMNACAAMAAFDLAKGTNVDAAGALLMSMCESGPSYAACRPLVRSSASTWPRAARILCQALDEQACVEGARYARREGLPLTLLELIADPQCPSRH